MDMDKIIIKNKKQIEGIRKSCQLAASTLRYIKQYVVPDITTEKLDRLIEDYIKSKNATSATLNYRGFKPGQPDYHKSSCISVNEEVCHGVPDNYILKEGDIVSIDVTTILDGYFGDTCITVPVGEISDDAKHLIKVTEKCLDLGIKQVKPGVRTGVIGHAIYKYAILQGCTVVADYCGHGCGFFFSRTSSNLTCCKQRRWHYNDPRNDFHNRADA